MLLYSVFSNFLILLITQIFIFNFLNFKKYWFGITMTIYFIICVTNYNYPFNLEKILDYVLLNLSFIISYILFLTLVFNDSPSIIYLKKNKNFFIKRRFIKNRLKLMKKDNLIFNLKRVTLKGKLAHTIILIMSKILFKEK